MSKHIKAESMDLQGATGNTPNLTDLTPEQHTIVADLMEDHSMQPEVDVMGAIFEMQARVQHAMHAPEWIPRRKIIATKHLKAGDAGSVIQGRKNLKRRRRKAARAAKQRNR